jgi:hypothetical protein
VFTFIFTLEMILMISGLGFLQYVEDPFNIFDGTIVIIGLVEYGM